MLVPVLLAAAAFATDVDGYQPGSSIAVGEGSLQAESATMAEDGASAALILGFVQDPVVRSYDALGYEESLVSAMVPVTLYGGWTVAQRARIDVFLPTYAHVQAPIADYQGAAMGDLRLQSVVNLWQGDTAAVGVVPRLEIPTGTADALTRRGVNAGLAFAANGQTADATGGWVANLGLTGSGNDPLAGVAMGSSVDVLGGGWWRPEGSFRVGAELDAHLGLARAGNGANHTANAHLFAQQAVAGGWGLMLGGGGGLVDGVGTPAWRAIAALHYGAKLPDPDGDGLFGQDDGCPNEAEDLDGFEDTDGCPDPDNDRDGVADADDVCPGAVEDQDGYEDGDGCPDEDNDGDGVSDEDDVCPDKAGDIDGCPDSDGDGMPDHFDACPEQARAPDERMEFADGCPKAAWFTDFSIAHADPVVFKPTTADLDPKSDPVLSAVLGLMLSHPEVVVIEILASTEPLGGPRSDLRLTERRAQAVKDWYLERGVAEQRLVATGVGQGPNDVGFRIVKVDKSRKAPLPVEQDQGTEAAPVGKPGNLSVVIDGGLEGSVFIDGEKLERKAPFTDQAISAGSHEIRVTNVRMGLDHTETIAVRPSEFVRVVVDDPREQVTEEIDEIWAPVRPDKELAPVPVGDDEADKGPPTPVIDVEVREGSGKRPPRSSKKR